MLISFVRALILYAFVVLVMRVMGKRQVGQLQPFELVVAIMIADLAAVPMENAGVPLVSGLVPIFALLLAQLSLSYITLKSERARALICGSPSIVIQNGRIDYQELKKQRLNLNDLLEQLRDKNLANVSDVEFAILETTGHLSVIPKSQKRPVTPEDLHLSTSYEGIPLTLILDGHIHHQNLSKANLDPSWLDSQLQAANLRAEDILFASLDTQGRLDIQQKKGGAAP